MSVQNTLIEISKGFSEAESRSETPSQTIDDCGKVNPSRKKIKVMALKAQKQNFGLTLENSVAGSPQLLTPVDDYTTIDVSEAVPRVIYIKFESTPVVGHTLTVGFHASTNGASVCIKKLSMYSEPCLHLNQLTSLTPLYALGVKALKLQIPYTFKCNGLTILCN